MALKFAQITASVVNFTTIDALLGVQSLTSGGGNDRLFSLPQLASAILSSPTIGGHATIEGVLLSGATGTGKLVLDHLPTIGTATINNSTLGTATINNSTLGTATLNVATLNTATLNNPAINTATINTSTLNSPVINTATINAPVINNPALVTATINTGTLNNVTINTAALNNITVSTGTLNNATLNTATINSSTLNNATLNTAALGTATINNSAINTATINNSTLGTAVINNSTLGTAAINNSTLGTATLNSPTLNTATINTGTLNNVLVNPAAATTGFILKSNGTLLAPSWAGGMVLLNTLSPSGVSSTSDTSSFSATYRDYLITFENVAPATQAQPFQMTLATSGSSFTTASYVSTVVTNANITIAVDSFTSALLLSGSRATTAVASSTVYGLNGQITLFNPSSSVANKSIIGLSTYLASTNAALNTTTLAFSNIAGFYTQASPVTGVSFAFLAGNIATGTIKIYGIN